MHRHARVLRKDDSAKATQRAAIISDEAMHVERSKARQCTTERVPRAIEPGTRAGVCKGSDNGRAQSRANRPIRTQKAHVNEG